GWRRRPMNGCPLAGTSEASPATRQATRPNVKAEDSALENGPEMTDGKNVWPSRMCCWCTGTALIAGPRSVWMGLEPRKAANSVATGGRFAARAATGCEMPWAVSPLYSDVCRPPERPTIMKLKKMPIDSTIAEFMNVAAIHPAAGSALVGGEAVHDARP